MKIDMSQNTFAPHEYIMGKVILKLKKPIRARGLSIRLEGKEMVYHEGAYDEDHVREWQIFCDITLPLGGDMLYSSGEYEFRLEVPNEASRGLGRARGAAGKALKGVVGFVGAPGVVEWHLFARLDIPMGIDLTDKKPIYFRMTGDVPRKSAREEFKEASPVSTTLGGRRRQMAIGMKDTPGDEVYSEAVALCPQCESPYLKKKKPKQCDTCGEFLPQE